MTILFITQKLHGQDAFGILWVRALKRQGFDVTVLCLEDRASPLEFPVYSMGKEKGYGKVRQILRFWRLILTLRYDRVFIHMSPVWGLLGSWWWAARRIPTYLWYTHYKYSPSLRITAAYAKRLFCATPQSLPHYQGSPKKVVVGHGIDMTTWPKRENRTENPNALLMVHRLSRSKRVELSLRALTLLPEDYTLEIYGIEAEPVYVAELRSLVSQWHLERRVTFHGTVPFTTLPGIYTTHRLILNMASETIDKTMLEAMTCGCYPATTQRNAAAIGVMDAPADDTPEALAHFIRTFAGADPAVLYRTVEERHGLDRLAALMGSYIKDGR